MPGISLRAASIALLATMTAHAPANAADRPLVRKMFLGTQLAPDPQSRGVAVANLFPGGTGEAIGLRTGDVINAVDGQVMRAPDDVIRLVQTIRANHALKLSVLRDGKAVEIAGRALPKPLETYANATVDYGQVSFRDGRLRDILVMPAGKPGAPVVFYIQGYTCASMEASPADPFAKKFGDALLARGLGYYRVEKIGIGDSDGPLKCGDVDFATELDGFRAAYRHLMNARKIAPERIFMIGHSMGGLQAPFLAAETAPRGVAVYGTVVRNWADYHQDLSQTQEFLIVGEDPAEVARRGEHRREAIRMFYLDKKSPETIAAANPANGQVLRDIANWDGGKNMFGRSWKFAQDLASLPLIQAWKDSKTNVLAMYGESDMVALTDIDHRYLADIANYWRPGSGTYVMIAKTDHPMDLVGTRSEVRAAYRSGTPPKGEFNPLVVGALADWIDAMMAKPPVATGG